MPLVPLRRQAIVLIILVFLALLLPGCSQPAEQSAARAASLPTGTPIPTAQPTSPVVLTPTTSPTATKTVVPTVEPLRMWVPDTLPEAMRKGIQLPSPVQTIADKKSANLWLEISNGTTPAATTVSATWVYALVAPFPTPLDEISAQDLHNAWNGTPGSKMGQTPLSMDAETQIFLKAAWGPAGASAVKIVDQPALLQTAWDHQPAWAIVPFEQIEPRWKVLRVNGQSPLEKSFDAKAYPLAFMIQLGGSASELAALPKGLILPTNRDPQKLTVLNMTGVTALSRHIGEVMESKGITYPARDIGKWLADADLTHVSNEVSFYQDCPKPGPQRADMRFCSNPKYIQLLEAIGANIIELTGNHNLDWGIDPFLYTLKLYQQRGWKTFGGGVNLVEARKALLIEDHGNKLAFIGCSPAGPEPVWATNDKPGSAVCDLARMEKQVRELKGQGYLPVVTFQAVEIDQYVPYPAENAPDFRRMASAGAVIVSGSQSHVPQTMTFVGGNFVHYGLGNLFFDQMTPPESRQAFIDRHTFYDGKYLGVELYTTLLEEYARPRPMTSSEREEFLKTIFSLSDWSGK